MHCYKAGTATLRSKTFSPVLKMRVQLILVALVTLCAAYVFGRQIYQTRLAVMIDWLRVATATDVAIHLLLLILCAPCLFLSFNRIPNGAGGEFR